MIASPIFFFSLRFEQNKTKHKNSSGVRPKLTPPDYGDTKNNSLAPGYKPWSGFTGECFLVNFINFHLVFQVFFLFQVQLQNSKTPSQISWLLCSRNIVWLSSVKEVSWLPFFFFTLFQLSLVEHFCCFFFIRCWQVRAYNPVHAVLLHLRVRPHH